ncbi:MAG: KH domain-containing protein [Proteobacteria bacterium]|nr:KH domain-containing protein [Pseudomonadota bacterium]
MTDNIDTEIWVEEFLTDLIDRTGLDVVIDEMSLDDEDTLCVQLVGPDSARVIGRDGQALDALQHIVAASSIHAGAGRQRIMIDVENYRRRREDRVCDEAVRLAREALDTGEFQNFIPMSPRERRLVHRAVADIEGVTTKSQGEGDERFVRIIPMAQ